MLNRLFTPKTEKNDGLTQVQREAIVDVLHYCMYADNFIALTESRFIAAKVDSFSWDPKISFDYYQGRSIGAARAALANAETKKKFFDSVRQRLPEGDLRKTAFELCMNLFSADGNKSTGEFASQGEIRKELEIS
jgi:hypothetical protein